MGQNVIPLNGKTFSNLSHCLHTRVRSNFTSGPWFIESLQRHLYLKICVRWRLEKNSKPFLSPSLLLLSRNKKTFFGFCRKWKQIFGSKINSKMVFENLNLQLQSFLFVYNKLVKVFPSQCFAFSNKCSFQFYLQEGLAAFVGTFM